MNGTRTDVFMELSKEILGKKLVGKKLRSYTYTVERGKIREFCQAIGETNPLYLDPEFAKSKGYKDTPVPPTFQTAFQFWGYKEMWSDMEAMGIDTKRLLHMKEEYHYNDPVYPGDEIRAEVVVDDVKVGKMSIVVFHTTYYNQENQPCIEAKFSIIIRPEEEGASS